MGQSANFTLSHLWHLAATEVEMQSWSSPPLPSPDWEFSQLSVLSDMEVQIVKAYRAV